MAAILYKLSLRVTKHNLKIYSVSTSRQAIFFYISLEKANPKTNRKPGPRRACGGRLFLQK